VVKSLLLSILIICFGAFLRAAEISSFNIEAKPVFESTVTISIAFKDDPFKGSLLCTYHGNTKQGTIETVFIKEGNRNQGLGSKLVRQAIEELNKRGAQNNITVVANPHSKESEEIDPKKVSLLIRFYEKLGFGVAKYCYLTPENPKHKKVIYAANMLFMGKPEEKKA